MAQALQIDINHYRDGLFEWQQLLKAALAILFVGFYVPWTALPSSPLSSNAPKSVGETSQRRFQQLKMTPPTSSTKFFFQNVELVLRSAPVSLGFPSAITGRGTLRHNLRLHFKRMTLLQLAM